MLPVIRLGKGHDFIWASLRSRKPLLILRPSAHCFTQGKAPKLVAPGLDARPAQVARWTGAASPLQGCRVLQSPTIPVLLQRAPRLQRAEGAGRIQVRRAEGATRLARLYQDGCAKIRLPTDHAARGLEAVLINTSGGLTGGDRMSWQVDALEGAALTLATQACEKVYRARPSSQGDGEARVAVTLNAGAGARVDWLPQETILFDGAALARTLDAELAEGASLLVAEAVILGRTAMNETVRTGDLRDRWRIRREGRLVFADDLRFSGEIDRLTARAPILDGARAFASLLLVTDDAERFLPALRAVMGGAGGASAFDGKLFCRLAAPDGISLRRSLLPALKVLRDGAPCPRVWGL